MKLLRQSSPDPQQLALRLDFFSPDASSSTIDHPAPVHQAGTTLLTLSPQPLPDAPTLTPKGKRRIQVGNHELDYTLVRSKRRSIGFLIGDDGLRLTAPKWVTIAEIESAIREKQRWIFTKLNEWQNRVEQRALPQIDWKDGAQVPYLGKPVSVTLAAAQVLIRASRAESGLGAADAVSLELSIPRVRYDTGGAVGQFAARAEERLRLGKPALGQLELSATKTASGVVIELSDDGRGIDWSAVRSKAQALNLLEPGGEELSSVLFRGGVSTAATVTAYSGRGAGVSACYAACRQLGGEVTVTSQRGRGTTFRFSIPHPSFRPTRAGGELTYGQA